MPAETADLLTALNLDPAKIAAAQRSHDEVMALFASIRAGARAALSAEG